jgi:hypothetical protein
MLERFDIQRSMPFSLKYSSKNNTVLALANDIWKDLPIDKTIKVDLKMQCLISCLINMKIGWETLKYVRYSRTKEYYTNFPGRYKFDYFTHAIMLGVIDGMQDLGLLNSETGFFNPEEQTGQLSKLKVADDFVSELRTIKNKMILDIQPPELIILKERGKYGSKLDYDETDKTLKMKKAILEYNELRQSTNFTLKNIKVSELEESERIFLNAFALEDFSLNSETIESLRIRNPYIYRTFNDSWIKGGRYYNGLESNMSEYLRKHLHINGNETVELDYSCLHIQMLYNKEGLELKENAYDKLSNGNKDLRDLFKLIGLVSINSTDKSNALNGIRNEMVDFKIAESKGKTSKKKNYGINKLFKDLSDISIDYYYQQWVNAHPAISKYLNSDVGIKLQYQDSQIASNVIEHFTKRGIACLVIHDSFIVEKKYEAELKEMMIKEYKRKYKFQPVIK